jgi:hypothetical protein
VEQCRYRYHLEVERVKFLGKEISFHLGVVFVEFVAAVVLAAGQLKTILAKWAEGARGREARRSCHETKRRRK